MHSNASVTMLDIKISKQLLEHHAGKAGEIKAILMHEITHWKEMHLLQQIFVDIVYMMFFGLYLAPMLNNQSVLRTFGFRQESTFVSLYLSFKLWSVSADYVLRKGINWVTRNYEYLAD